MNCILIWNVVVALIYATDKALAKHRKKRIRESVLLLVAFVLGGAGAMFGMVIFNHKTSKMKFRIFVPLALLFNIILIKFYYIYL